MTGLARVTIASPRRRIDVALPEGSPVAELLPRILAHAGEGLADEGETHGGWMLRRADGTPLTPGRTLTAHNIHDGEILYLVPRRAQWPELDYDDVVDAIATGAKAHGPAWSGPATRRTALTIAGVALALGWLALLFPVPGSGRLIPGLFALGTGLVLVVTGIVLARALADGLAGATVALYGLPYGFLGGLTVLADPAFTPANLLLGSAALLVLAVTGYAGVADTPRFFAAAITTALYGLLGGLLALWLGPAGAAALVATALLGLTAAYPLLSMRLGKLPVPAVTIPDDGLAPLPDRARVFSAVARADELLTGMLQATLVTWAATAAILTLHAGVPAGILVLVVSAALILRARLFPAVRHRLPLLVSGVLGLTALTLTLLAAASPAVRLVAGFGTLLVLAGAVLTAGLVYSRRTPSPYLGRAADILDVVLVISVVPVACSVLGLYSLLRGLGG
ncbi:type VII secretion integral membrane protein EccD [Longispora albida]|uniref:type VII secretion integral membrane protein EccD n=1 Tax=Longispora albida TaxID=203523 RepID=UPI000475EF61|nr:type VII secretion integral membrane protein EccD [Longispora albida]